MKNEVMIPRTVVEAGVLRDPKMLQKKRVHRKCSEQRGFMDKTGDAQPRRNRGV